MDLLTVIADFGPVSESEVGARNGQERVECGLERPIRVAGAVRRRSQESAQVRGNRRNQAKKIPTDKGWDFWDWWSRRESNPRPEILYGEFYILSLANWI